MSLTRKQGRVRRRRSWLKAGGLFACCLLACCLVLAAPRAVERRVVPRAAAPPRAPEPRAASDEFNWPGEQLFTQRTRTASTPAAAAGVRTDRKVYRKPLLPALPRAGGKYVDAVFGTEVMRATDERDCPVLGCGTWYSHWPTFNADNTLILIRSGVNGDAIIKRFDPVRFELGETVRAHAPMLPGGVTLEWQGATWSATDPDLIYLHVNNYGKDYPATGMKLYSYRVSTNALKIVKDFAPELSPGQPDFLYEMHMDAHDDVFTFMHKRVGKGSEPIAFIIWSQKRNKVLAHVPNDFNVNACYPDKSGRWVAFMLNAATPGQPRVKVLNLQTGAWDALLWVKEDDPPMHGDFGTGFFIGRSPWTAGVSRRSFADIHRKTYIYDMKDERGVTDWSNDQHTTLYADNEDWALLGTLDDPSESMGETGAYEDELMQVSTDGSGRIRRLLHTRTRYDNLTETSGYWAAPKPTISKDGRFVAYTSNWEGSGRYDLFIAKIDPAPRLTSENTQASGASHGRAVRRQKAWAR